MQFFSFSNMLPSALTTTGMTLMLATLHILLIFLFSSSYLSIFSFSFLLPLTSPGTPVSIMSHLSVILAHNITFFIFKNTFWSMLVPFFTFLQVVFPTQCPMNSSGKIIVPFLVLLLCQIFTFAHNEILFHFSCHTF